MSNFYASTNSTEPANERVQFPLVPAVVAGIVFSLLMSLLLYMSSDLKRDLTLAFFAKAIFAFSIPYLLAVIPSLAIRLIKQRLYKDSYFTALKYCLILYSSLIVGAFVVDFISTLK